MAAPFSTVQQRLLLLLASLLLAPGAWAAPTLAERYQQLKEGSLPTLPGSQLSILSSEQDNRLQAEVVSLLPERFTTVATALGKAENWCQFMPLHFNIKACTYETSAQGTHLNIYSGSKHYQTPEESYQIGYRFEASQSAPDKLSLRLGAARGPANTRDYRISLDALAVAEGTLLYIHSSYRPSMLSTLLTNSYLSTVGRNKVGFSADGEGDAVQGVRGVIERNVIRYQLAIASYLATLSQPQAKRHEAALVHWLRSNDRYPQQLQEMSEGEYLQVKRREWQNQQRLQRSLDERLVALR